MDWLSIFAFYCLLKKKCCREWFVVFNPMLVLTAHLIAVGLKYFFKKYWMKWLYSLSQIHTCLSHFQSNPVLIWMPCVSVWINTIENLFYCIWNNFWWFKISFGVFGLGDSLQVITWWFCCPVVNTCRQQTPCLIRPTSTPWKKQFMWSTKSFFPILFDFPSMLKMHWLKKMGKTLLKSRI